MGRRALTDNLLGGFPVAALDLNGARAPCALLPQGSMPWHVLGGLGPSCGSEGPRISCPPERRRALEKRAGLWELI